MAHAPDRLAGLARDRHRLGGRVVDGHHGRPDGHHGGPNGGPNGGAVHAPSSLATTGPGPHLWVVAVVGFIVLYLGSVVLALVERPRSLLRRVLRLAPRAVPVVAIVLEPAAVSPTDRSHTSGPSPPSAKPAYPKAGGSPGLWFDGWEPQGRNRD